MTDTPDPPRMRGSRTATASASSPLRLLVLGEPRLYRRGLALVLKDYAEDLDIHDVARADPDDDALVDVGLLALPADPGLALALVMETTVAMPTTPLLAHTLQADPAIWARIMNCGVRGIVGPDVEVEILTAALRLVAAGGAYLPPELISQAVVPRTPRTAYPPLSSGRRTELTEREHAVLGLVGRSFSNQEIATELGITETTVRVHVRNLRQKLQARSRVDLALLAVQVPR